MFLTINHQLTIVESQIDIGHKLLFANRQMTIVNLQVQNINL